MNFKICKMHFSTGLHIGKGLLTDGEPVFYADTLFSALCHEALKMEKLDTLFRCCKEGYLKFSDGMPFIQKELYLPKPLLRVETDEEGSSKMKKLFKKLSYIPVEKFEEYLQGNLDVQKEKEKYDTLGKFQMTQKVSVAREEEPEPYFVGSYHFQKEAGLYVIVSYDTEEVFDFFMELMRALEYSGIGGKRTSGYGKFQLEFADMPKKLQERMDMEKYSLKMVVSLALPTKDELKEACNDANFQVIKRSGFVASDTYAKHLQRKKDFYAFASGSCFQNTFDGDIYDVSLGGSHPVYQYAIPIFVGVKEWDNI